MSRNKKILKNIIILITCFALLNNLSYYKLSPLAAHKASEKSAHYGPSQIVHIEDFEEGKYILCKYDNWISCNTVLKDFGFLWRFGNQPTGIENKKEKAVEFTFSISEYGKLYGIINNPSITKIEVKLNDGTKIEKTKFYKDMFLFTWVNKKSNNYLILDTITAYNNSGEVVFSETY